MTARPTPSQAYACGLAAGEWQADPSQRALLVELDRLQQQLIAATPGSVWQRLTASFRPPATVRGLYLWGGVGRGKTFLTDLLYEAVPVAKQRWHFHRFMGEIHHRLRALPDTADTLSVVACDLAAQMRLLVLDEFFVGDIGDAMILGRLLEQLFARGVTLVTTSNTVPGELYRDGLQRASFLPAIALLQQHCLVWRLDGATDYRLRQLTRAATYLSPLGEASEAALMSHYRHLSGGHVAVAASVSILDREIDVKAISDGVVWFDFSDLCEGPRSASDYVEIARDFHTLLLSGVPRFDDGNEEAALRFVYLIDELYDRHVNLLLSAAADPLSLYQGQKFERPFERTASRLIEMQSAQYLAREHRP